jgi:hypothetical protein
MNQPNDYQIFVQSYMYPRQAEYLHDIANIYADISGIDRWWIGLSDLGK